MSIIIKSGTSGNLAAVSTDGEILTAADTQTYNGTAWEKAKSANAANATTGTGVPASGTLGFDGTNWHRIKAGGAGDLAVSITNPNAAYGGIFAGVSATGALNVTTDPIAIFTDTFEGGVIDTVNKWTPAGTVTPTNTNSLLVLNLDTTANATSTLTTMPAFQIATSVVLGVSVALEATATTGNHRFWGFGVPPSTPGTATAPLQDAIGFEVDTAGALRASAYAGGVRVFTQQFTRPADTNAHVYVVQARGDVVFFSMDTFDVPGAVTYAGPNVKLLPLRFANLNGATVTGTPLMSVAGMSVLDPTHAAAALCDGTFPWRKAKVDATGALQITGRPSDLVVSATAAVSGTVTATLPAAGAGLYHYITGIEITRYATTLIGGSATPTVVTTTNLPGSLAWTTSTAGNQGAITDRISDSYPASPLRSSVTNTATTIVAPATTSVIWRVTVRYYTAP